MTRGTWRAAASRHNQLSDCTCCLLSGRTYWLYSVWAAVAPALLNRWRNLLMLLLIGCQRLWFTCDRKELLTSFHKGCGRAFEKKKEAFNSHTFIYVWQPAYAFFRPRSYRPAQNCSHRSKYLYRCRQMQAAEREGRLTVKGGINSLRVEMMNNRDYHRCWQWRREAVTAVQSNRAPLGKKRDEEDDTKVCPVWW